MLVIVFLAIASAQVPEGEVIVSNNKTECVNDMIEWCNSMQYPEQAAGMSMEAVDFGTVKVFCSSDSDGTVCTRDGTPWFSCSSNHTLTYKGRVLSPNASADDGICPTADKAFNDLFVQNLQPSNETLKEEVEQTFEAFFQQLTDMQEKMEKMQKEMDILLMFFKRYLWGELMEDILVERVTVTSTQQSNITDQINWIE